MRYLNSKIDDFLSQLSSRKSVPGGGSASALEASLGAAMHLMVLNYSEAELGAVRMRKLKTEQEKSLEILQRCIDEDAEAFGSLMRSFSTGADSQSRYKDAAEVPLKVAKECSKGLILLNETKNGYNKRLITDLGGALYAFKCAAHSAVLNVEINLQHIEDKRYAAKIKQKIRDTLGEVAGNSDEISRSIEGFSI